MFFFRKTEKRELCSYISFKARIRFFIAICTFEDQQKQSNIIQITFVFYFSIFQCISTSSHIFNIPKLEGNYSSVPLQYKSQSTKACVIATVCCSLYVVLCMLFSVYGVLCMLFSVCCSLYMVFSVCCSLSQRFSVHSDIL